MQDLLELAVSATASGCIYGLIALAYLLMIRPTGIINFAVGEWAMVAAFGGHLLLYRYEWPYAIGMAAVVAFMMLVGWGTERIAVRPLGEKVAPLLAPIPSGYTQGVPLLFLMIFLLVRPTGLLRARA